MKARLSLVRYICLILSTAALTGGYALLGSWVGMIAVLLLAVIWVTVQKYLWPWLASLLMAGFLGAAVRGILLGGSPQLMIAGSAFALAAWELTSKRLDSGQGVEDQFSIKLQKNSLMWLVISIGLGLLTAQLILLVQVIISFWVLFFAALVVMASLYLLFRLLRSHPE